MCMPKFYFPVKHRLSEETHFDRLKCTKLATTASAPSTIAKPSSYMVIQDVFDERVFYDRPTPDYHIPPIPLLYGVR